MAWQLNEPGLTLNEADYRLNSNPVVAAVKNLYAGGVAAAKRLTRGLGF